MKKIIAFGAVVFCSLVLLPSCSKNSSADLNEHSALNPDRVITAKVSPGETQTLNIDNLGELSIVRQALHFKISQAGIDPKNSSLIYSYSPADGFTGNDEVLLAHKIESFDINTASPSCSNNSGDSKMSMITTYIAIKITVAQ